MASPTLPSADIRGYYRRLGIPLGDGIRVEISVRCFADPATHRREDRDPSCSVNTVHGAWHCHGCGARGGAYDAALALGHTSRQAIDLMITHGLIDRRARLTTARDLLESSRGRGADPAASRARARDTRQPAVRSIFEITEQDIDRWQSALSRRPSLLARLADERGWRFRTMHHLGLGIDRGRITIPIRDHKGLLRGLLRYQPDHTRRPKMLAATGSHLGLIPHPAAEPADHILLVEGPPDMIAARSRGLAAIAVPGDHAWRREWAQLLTDRRVTVIMDADRQGRAAALRIAEDLADHTQAQIVDLAPHRSDGYDLTDWLRDNEWPACADIESEISRKHRDAPSPSTTLAAPAEGPGGRTLA